MGGLTIELYPGDDHCVQGCADCPRGNKEPEVNREEPYYSVRAMAIIEKLKLCSFIQTVQLSSLSDRTEQQSLIALPPISTLRSVVVGAGDVHSDKSEELVVLADKVFDNVTACLKNQSPSLTFALGFSVVPALNEDLSPRDPDSLMKFFDQLLRRTTMLDFPHRLNQLFFGMSNNDVSREWMAEVFDDFEKVQRMQRLLRNMVLELTDENGPIIDISVSSLMNQDEGVKAVANSVKVVREWACSQISVAHRLIEANKGKVGRGSRQKEIEGHPFGMALFSDYAWLYHSKDAVSDKSLIISFDELERIIDSCCSTEPISLKMELDAWIAKRRALAVID